MILKPRIPITWGGGRGATMSLAKAQIVTVIIIITTIFYIAIMRQYPCKSTVDMLYYLILTTPFEDVI